MENNSGRDQKRRKGIIGALIFILFSMQVFGYTSVSAAAVKDPKVGSYQLTAFLKYKPVKIPIKNLRKDAEVNYRSLNEKVATVSKDGYITAKKLGKAVMVVDIYQGKHYNYWISVTVKKPYVDLISLPEYATVGQKVQFEAVMRGMDGVSIKWSSGNTQVATIEEDTGLLTALAPGRVKILVKGMDTDFFYFDIFEKEISDNTTETPTTSNQKPAPTLTPQLTATPQDQNIVAPTPIITVDPTPRPSVTTSPKVPTEDSVFTYRFYNSEVTITGLKQKEISTVTIPEQVNGNPVVSIESGVFNNCNNLKSIIIPPSVRTIANDAINTCYSLETLFIPASVKEIKYMISGCPNLKNVTVGIETLGVQFMLCSGLENLVVLEGTTQIAGSAFSECNNLRTVTLPNTLKSIGEGAFVTTSLANINIPDSVTQIEDDAFNGCGQLKNINISDNFNGIIAENAFLNTPVETIAGAYNNHCIGILGIKRRAALEVMLNVINNQINTNSDYEIVKSVHDWILDNVSYGYVPGDIESAYTVEGTIRNHMAVCQGYSLTFKDFMEMFHIPCQYVSGVVPNGGHSWNLVYVYGDWYHVDCTFDDKTEKYKYFMVSDSVMEADHIWDKSQYPSANKNENSTH